MLRRHLEFIKERQYVMNVSPATIRWYTNALKWLDSEAPTTESDVKKLIRDAKERHAAVGIIVAKDESQLRQADRECRWAQEDGVWVLRTTRGWFRRDLDVLRPVLERMRTEGADFLQKNAALADEVRRTLVDLDEVEKELKKAAKSIELACGLTSKYRTRLQAPCGNTTAPNLTQSCVRFAPQRECFRETRLHEESPLRHAGHHDGQ
jgi:hypothetical protein